MNAPATITINPWASVNDNEPVFRHAQSEIEHSQYELIADAMMKRGRMEELQS